jgi:hypothetical protein
MRNRMRAPSLRPGVVFALLLVAATLRIGLALAQPNLFWPDEIYQTLEPAHRLVFGHGIESFEWRIGLRSYVLPGILSAVVFATAPLAAGSSGYVAGVVVSLALLSLWPIAAAARIAAQAGGARAAWFAAVLAAVWFDLVYFAPKALTEVVAGHLLVPAIAIGLGAATNARRPVFVASMLLGLVVSIRPHLAPGAAVAWSWFVLRAPRLRWSAALCGAASSIVLFGLVDWFTHGRPFGSLVVNVTFNVGDARSLDWGWLPKHFYAVYLWRTWTPPVAVAFALLWVLGLRRAPLPGLVAMAILGSHSLLGHKEYRFVYPALPLLLVGVAVGAAVVVERLRAAWQRPATIAVLLAFVAASLWAGLDFHRAKTPTGLGDRRAAISYWSAFGDPLRAMRELSLRDDVRGVAVLGVEWQYCGGYTWLHQPVPLYFVDRPETPSPAWPHVNYVVAADAAAANVPAGFVEVSRHGAVRVLRRDGEVTPRPGYDVSEVLQGR